MSNQINPLLHSPAQNSEVLSDQYDFNQTLSRLDEISKWLNDMGLTSVDRVRIYRRNIRRMIEVQASGGMQALRESIPVAEAREIFWSYIDADEFVRAVMSLRDRLGDEAAVAPIKKALHGPADLLLESPNNSDGRNFMFELIMGGRFAGAGLRPSFDKRSDVHVEFAGLTVGTQCKRPFSDSGLEKNIKKAIHQLEEGRTDLNLIAISVSRLLNTGDPGSMPEVARHELGHPYLQQRIREIAERTHRFWSRKMPQAGILFYAFTAIQCPESPRYFFD